MKEYEFKNLIEQVKTKTDIVRVVGRYVQLNSYNKALCPFHNEKTPSFHVDPRKQIFRCFGIGCGKRGDVIEFVELIEHMSFWEALTKLAREAGVSIPKFTPEYEDRVKEIRQIEAVLQETAEFYHKNLPEKAKEYLISERGFTEKTIERFQIGCANGGLRSHLIENPNYSLEACLKAGVLKREDNGEIRDYFYRRIIFPNIKRGRVVHLTGRSLDGKKPKYLHLPGEMQYLYNEDALIGRNVLVGEGPTDAISAEQAGIPTVAVLGSNSKPKFVSKFSQVEVVYIALDGDDAGKKGILKIAEPFGDKAKIIELPKGNDLNDYFRVHSKEDFKKLAVNAKDLVEYQVSLIPASIKKIDLPGKLEPILKRLACMNKVKVEAYLDEIKKHFKLKKPDVDGYRELIKGYRQDNNKEIDIKASNSDNNKCYTASFEGLVDIVEHKGNPAFLIKEGEALSILSEIDRDGVIYVPPPRENIPWILPRGEEVLKYYDERNELTQEELDEQLYYDLLVYHVDISELPSEAYYDLLVAWDMHTYLQEQLQYSPIINLFAVPERGKTRTGKGMIYVAFRGIHVECLREAYIIRVTNDLHASIFFDVMDIWRKLEKYRSEDILLQRYEKGAIAPRVLYPEKGAHRDIVYYSIFGPTIVGTNRAIHKILDTRSIQTNMPETSKRFEQPVTPESALDLKERLVAFRAAHLGE